ncbi:MAG: Nif3-like dinuclear metal center hexameric protein [Candidatus Altiarchaeota archaeon]|nr:Nif3-like dinuclear metal center hexameric protein [Candidatus Altiarchaeota archaeon]
MHSNVNELSSWMNTYLKVSDFSEDASMNGLQVHSSDEVNKVALAVDAGLDIFQRAKKYECDMVIAHHGMYWKGIEPLIVGPTTDRVRFLLDNKISLYASHLPLDAHSNVGNNVEIIRALGFRPKKLFDKVSWICHPKKSLEELIVKVNEKIGTSIHELKFGDEFVNDLVVSSGGGTASVFTAPEGSTVLLGELSHYGYHYAQERHLNVIAAGHYATEKFGVIALGKLLEKKFKKSTVFIDVPTNI